MRGIEVDKGLVALEKNCVERDTLLRRDMVRIRGRQIFCVLEWYGDWKYVRSRVMGVCDLQWIK